MTFDSDEDVLKDERTCKRKSETEPETDRDREKKNVRRKMKKVE